MNVLDFWFPNDKFNKFWFDKSKDSLIINNYQECINKVDIVYMTRIQKERTN